VNVFELQFHPGAAGASLAARLRRELQGEVLFDRGARGRYSTDASIYQIEPVGVVVPRTEGDALQAMRIAAEAGVPILPRGAGSSQCGQAVGAALVIDNTRHLNQVLEFDPAQVSYEDLLGAFWSMHNPTAPNRGPGSQYRSAIFVHDEEQGRLAEASKEAAQTRFVAPIVTEITLAPEFWEAEEYHQRYYERHGLAASCHTVA